MTKGPEKSAPMPLADKKRAAALPPPARRREIRERAGVSRQHVGAELGVSGTAIGWWENPNGFTPRNLDRRIAYRQLLDTLEQLGAELETGRPGQAA
jgi:transcriptional regulator with XRE-family HTH domain